MYNVSMVEIFDSAADLNHVSSNLREGQVSPLLKHIRQRPIGTQLEHDIGACLEGEGAVEGDDIGMREFRVDLEFADEL